MGGEAASSYGEDDIIGRGSCRIAYLFLDFPGHAGHVGIVHDDVRAGARGEIPAHGAPVPLQFLDHVHLLVFVLRNIKFKNSFSAQVSLFRGIKARHYFPK